MSKYNEVIILDDQQARELHASMGSKIQYWSLGERHWDIIAFTGETIHPLQTRPLILTKSQAEKYLSYALEAEAKKI